MGFLSAEIITLVQAIIRLLVPKYRHKWIGQLIGSGILFVIGFFLGDWAGYGWFWVVILAVIGISILAKVFTQK